MPIVIIAQVLTPVTEHGICLRLHPSGAPRGRNALTSSTDNSSKQHVSYDMIRVLAVLTADCIILQETIMGPSRNGQTVVVVLML